MKKSQITLPTDQKHFQSNMFSDEGKRLKWFPKVGRSEAEFWDVVQKGQQEGYLGLDFEFPETYRASIIGVACRGECCAIEADRETVSRVVLSCLEKGTKLVGHSVIGAEMRVVKETCGITQSIDEYDDSMLRHYLLNADWCKAPDKGEEDDAGALGFMGLWTCASAVLLWPAWKQCSGVDCEQVICPTHDVKGYCAVDAAASLECNYIHKEQFKQWNVPEKLYDELKELTLIAQQMQDQGIRVNMDFVREMERKSDEYKATLFNSESEFNPRAPVQVVDWFRQNGIQLQGNDKVSIRKALEKTASKYGYSTYDENGKFNLETLELSDALPKELDALYRLYEYKGAGKGLDPWFGKKYIVEENDGTFVHPRFITIGASTSRWSSSRPNFTNCPARGFGSLVKAAIIPRSDDLDLCHADSSNLELRICIYLGGFDPNEIIPGDPFTWLVQNSGGAFDTIAAINNDTPRGVAKTVSHANSYLEGIKILYPRDLAKPFIKKQIDAGVIRVYKDWEYMGGLVAFTGANLAERIFGDKSWDNRKRALAITEDVYFKQLPMLRDWHRKVLAEVQDKRFVQYPTGHFLRLYGSAEENAKVGCAALGQGVGAHYIQGQVLRFKRELNKIPIMFVHDSLTFEIPSSYSDQQAYDFVSLIGEENDRLPGFKAPFKAARGKCDLEYDPKKPLTNVPGAMQPLDKSEKP
jgi:DNA polymerase I-like protein with 3'-5' exonuclease and polymerase domains